MNENDKKSKMLETDKYTFKPKINKVDRGIINKNGWEQTKNTKSRAQETVIQSKVEDRLLE
jgi:hypothetical protein